MKGEKEEMSRMSKKRKSIKSFSIAGLFIMIAVVLFTMTGCSDDKATSITNPEATAFKPTGTIEGVVRDSVTLKPIAGAKVAIGVAEATTDANGIYVLSNVPATTDALNGTTAATYNMVVDLTNVTSPVNMKDLTATPRYPEIAHRTVSVSFTSLNDSAQDCTGPVSTDEIDDLDGDNDAPTSVSVSGNGACGTSATNHDTPVTQLATNLLIGISKLDGNITGIVAGCDSSSSADFFTSVGAGYKVELFTAASSGDTGSGASGHLLASTTTDSDGKFTFNNVEAGLPIVIITTSADGTKTDTVGNVTPVDGRTLDLTDIQASVALHACSTDIHGPRIVEVTPEPGSDLTSGDNTVTLTFSEPVAQNAFTSTEPSGVANLFDFIEVNFDGAKAGNVSYSLAWNTAFDELTVTIPNTGISSLYHVRVVNTSTVLADSEGNGVEMGVCPDDSIAPAPFGIAANVGSDDCTVWFTTKGSATPAAPVVTLVNGSGIDEGTQQVGVLDWGSTSGAKTYNVYCRTVQVWGTTEQAHAYVQIPAASILGSSASVDFDALTSDSGTGPDAFVENDEIELVFDCYVTGVSADAVEGPASNVVRVDDEVGPTLVEDATGFPIAGTGGGALLCGTGATVAGLPANIGALCTDGENIDQIVLGYNEEMDEVSTETTDNYDFSGLASGDAAISTTTLPVYNPLNHMVLLTLSDTLTPTELARPIVRTGDDGILDTTAAAGDTVPFYIGAGGGVIAATGLGGPCVDPGGDGILDTTAGDDDDATTVPGFIFAGPNYECDSTANDTVAGLGDDIQVVASGELSGVCGTEATADATPAGDDLDTDGAGTAGMILTGANGVCDTTTVGFPAGTTQLNSADSSTPDTAGIIPGADADLDTTTLDGDDAFEGTKLTVSGVEDISGNTIQPDEDVFNSGGNVTEE